MIDRNTIDRIMDRADIVDVVGDFVALKKHGKDYIGLCPFHDDSRPSFNVSTSKNICKCFACGVGGTPVSFLEKYLHLTFPDAIKYLGKKYGIPVVETQLSAEEQEARTERDRLLSANAFARDAFTNELHNGNEGRLVGLKYFRDRELSDETIKQFELGYSPRDRHFLYSLAKEKGISPDALEQVGLLFRTDDGQYIDRYRDRVIYPIHSISGSIVGFGGRILVKKENTGKYINSPASSIYDKSRELYGLYFAKQAIAKKDKCIVVEGYMDVLSMHQRGITNVVASSGTALTTQQVQKIKRFTSNLTFIFDSDAAGIKAAMRGLDVGLERGMSLHTVLLPEGEDPDSFAKTHSAEEIELYIREHEEDSLRFNARVLSEQNGTDTPQGIADTVAVIAESMAHIQDKLILDIYVKDMAPRLGVEPKHLLERIQKLQQQQRNTIRREWQNTQHRQEQQKREEDEAGASTTFGSSKSKGQATAPNERLNPFEITLLGEIMKNGLMEIPDYEIEPGRYGCSLIQVVQKETKDLRESGTLTTHFCTILDEVERLYEEEPNPDITKYLSWHEDPVILHTVADMLMNEEELSEMHSTYVSEASTPTEVVSRVMRTILSYKYDFVLRQISDLLQQLQSIPTDHQEGDEALDEKSMELLSELANLNQMKVDMSRMLGDRILTPTLKLQPRQH